MTSASRFYLPIYLHYFDRELSTAVNFTPTPKMIRWATWTLLTATPVDLYCNVSTTWECPASTRDTISFLARVIRFGHLQLLSHHKTLSEFIPARRLAYSHDRERYPMYFGDDTGYYSQLIPTHVKTSSATQAVHMGLLEWATGHEVQQDATLAELRIANKTKKAVEKSLTKRSEEAVTYAFFQSRFSKRLRKNPAVSGVVRREISHVYTKHYLDDLGGDLPTGLSGLSQFDKLAKSFPYYDLPILTTVLDRIGLRTGMRQELWEEFLAVRGGHEHRLFCDTVRAFLAGVLAYCRKEVPLESSIHARNLLNTSVDRFLRDGRTVPAGEKSAVNLLLSASALLHQAIERGSRDPQFAIGASGMLESLNVSRPLVLLSVATETERDAILQIVFGTTALNVPTKFKGDHTYFELGVQGGCELLLVKSGMGTGGPTGSQETLSDAIHDMRPTAVIMVGIAFGAQESKQGLGDILVSTQLQCYEKQRVGEGKGGDEDIIPRGSRVDAAPRLIDRFDAGVVGWHGAKVRFGLVLSGEKLVDSASFREKLLALEPEAIGGEMEGAGLYAASYKGKVDWILVKAICDWGHKKGTPDKKKHQKLAARNASQFVFHVIRQGGLAEGIC